MLRGLTVFICIATSAAYAEPIRIATWNIEHLRAEENIGSVPRLAADFVRLGMYADRLGADIVALQEVDGPEAAARVFPEREYDFFFSGRNNVQRTGFAVRKSLEVVQNPDIVDLGLDGNLRYGVDITVNVDGTPLRLLAVHLKSFCFQHPLSSGGSNNCQRLKQQIPVLEDWIDARAIEGVPFAVLGDFNRRFEIDENLPSEDSFWQDIDDGKPKGLDLSRVTAGRTSECWGGRHPDFIDHIVLDQIAVGWVSSGSFEQLVYDEADEQFDSVLSDHCPISVVLDIPPRQVEAMRNFVMNDAGTAAILSRIDALGVRAAELEGADPALEEIRERLETIERRLSILEGQ
ncbi:endonuclease/exonuclease/phosphatase family protein [Bauldia litoralis]|uniref:Metal-dependent hydrolase, endonuclease/exonuclease/phosphatase family n=1 Tax=Bauldia litoralis TaxID=665467 RepID=A0A1G6EMD4_9HYPH|nr:endonuclease/exonuclease/phosphatase family protein [Bauldia litoralis]SDB58619.1 Metal-dependent hydrolase, endonuclease/exonuclease/phosphatase family [Bauldia litoralis]